eukprot:CAMPEP_0183374066 /NCGR_PEP_ID=MMETSP0164_2-20130417/113402_1 /TAXON_ID=221442 /ORGANISM="Coccolithus pelagicus ssp braarudi, Strain PLY182g" /LENGTH=107 /DNA_ID=CAMNT_0025551051 /DNA_START=187 /DNA_END=507 /DNA_ORIENTATION=+
MPCAIRNASLSASEVNWSVSEARRVVSALVVPVPTASTLACSSPCGCERCSFPCTTRPVGGAEGSAARGAAVLASSAAPAPTLPVFAPSCAPPSAAAMAPSMAPRAA